MKGARFAVIDPRPQRNRFLTMFTLDGYQMNSIIRVVRSVERPIRGKVSAFQHMQEFRHFAAGQPAPAYAHVPFAGTVFIAEDTEAPFIRRSRCVQHAFQNACYLFIPSSF